MNQDIQEVIKVFIYNVSEKDSPVMNNTTSQAASYTTRRWKMRFRGSQADLGNWYWWRSRGLEFKRIGFKTGDQKGPKTRELRWFLQQAYSRAGWRTQLSTLPIHHRLDSRLPRFKFCLFLLPICAWVSSSVKWDNNHIYFIGLLLGFK